MGSEAAFVVLGGEVVTVCEPGLLGLTAGFGLLPGLGLFDASGATVVTGLVWESDVVSGWRRNTTANTIAARTIAPATPIKSVFDGGAGGGGGTGVGVGTGTGGTACPCLAASPGSSFCTVAARLSRCCSIGGVIASSQWTEPMK